MSEGDYNILLIEDSRTQAVRMEAMLAEAGWKVRWVTSGEEALEILSEFVPDLIMVDYHLPGMRGDAVCREIRMRIDTRVIAIIMLTMDNASAIETRALESGADDFIRKSADHELILLRARTLLRRSRMYKKILNPADSRIRRTRVLAVDDSSTYLAHLTDELQGEAYELETTRDPARALELVAEGQFDCVLVDLVMPEMTGVEVCRRIKSMSHTGNSPPMTLMLTAMDEREDLTRALDAGADDFVGKSSDSTVLKVRIRALLRRKYYEEENTRILAELKDKQLLIERTRMEKEAAEARASLVEQLKRTAAGLRETNADLERFAYIASHDLQEPLRMVTSYLQLLENQIGTNLEDSDRECMNFAINGAKRLKVMIGDLFTYSRIRARGNPYEPADLSAIFDHVAHEYESCGGVGAPTITRDDLPTLQVDVEQIELLLRHLIDNAVKFHAATAPEVRVETIEHEDDWLISISDNGIGIEPQYAERIFVIFQRLHTHDAYPGTGSGLAICKRIVERHGGKIWLDTGEHAGTTFRFTLPKTPIDTQESVKYATQAA
ncbi:MAG: response regulator [Phycisphaerales bacterium]